MAGRLGRSKKLNKPSGVATGKTQNCGKQSDKWASSAPVKGGRK